LSRVELEPILFPGVATRPFTTQGGVMRRGEAAAEPEENPGSDSRISGSSPTSMVHVRPQSWQGKGTWVWFASRPVVSISTARTPLGAFKFHP
jgi:hypothetical protein